MSTLRFPGLSTGIDTGKLIEQMMAIERRSLNLFKERISKWQERQDALSTLETKLTNLRNSVRALSDADALRAFSVASSDTDKLTANASYNAFEGNHNVVINQLANGERFVHATGKKFAEDYVGTGTFIYSYNNKETSITTTATTTLTDMVNLINNDADNPGITASLLYYNDAYHMVMNGNDAGSDYKISINASSTEVWQANSELTVNSDNATLSTKITNLDQFGSNPLVGGEVIEITGTDHFGNSITQVDISLTDNTKISHIIAEIEDAFDNNVKATFENGKIIVTDTADGTSSLSIILTYNAKGSAATLSLNPPFMAFSTEGGSTTANLTGFATSDFTLTQAAQDSKIKVDGYPTVSAVSEVQTLTLTAGDPDGGTYTLTYNGETTSAIAFDANKDVIQAAINALVHVNSGDIIVSETGSNGIDDGDVIFTFKDTLGNVPMILADDSLLAGPTLGVTETTKGVDAYISRSSNTVDDVIYGVALHLHDTTDANGEKLTLTRDIQSVKDKIGKLVDGYNFAVEFIHEKTGYNDTLKTAGLLMGDYVVSTIKQQIRRPLITQTNGFIEDIDTFLTPGHLGLKLDREGILSFDSNVFDEAIAEDYMSVLALIGADKTGSSDSNTIKFYDAHSDYTTAGSYRVKVTYDASGNIDTASIKLSSENDSQYRAAMISGNIITGDSTFDTNSDPVYPEHSLQLTALTTGTPSSTIYATVMVKQGFAGAIEEALDNMLKVTTGSIQIDQKHVDNQIKALQDKIDREETLLTKREERLVGRFARLEKNLSLIQQQMSSFGF
ncbi:MAG: flagellar filament capping protein FliD [Planctomycetes bacterium]|nr:flagellar filament capping protein FliD [Planctomycetota bacterium]MBL7144795.1 flagellar filament capping protein FliD [Phycisphaerae bacterium]